ncbi:16S rRNA (cytosine(1402)-N(4))-methyltransferase RsmH [Mesomycoplasma molare]|uniref:Ribosomal RNA small subunit methyltransferase H n=1 Tax=Mesomycoplasma molare TaxID=171288 RepID=A0ABY5TV93_9BACT|nr:16S rRNA (cytosine(1402)-N(4))-methyltransferase RsmH [Mesomycoplasma molare]UWD34562.1 16S rRNA (cytosine(1402)-N(4))-methyltransferase RsmH [Mesomycoplasma molare]
MKHFPVLLEEVIENLKINKNGIYVDLTLGRAGHSSEILKKLDKGHLYAFDKDFDAIKESEKKLSKISNNFTLIHSDFQNLESELKKYNIKKIDGILVDLGVSSPQLDEAERGFSYNKDARLDMRMNRNQTLDAHYIVNHYSEEELISLLKNNADVMLPQRVAKGIILNRPINTTLELVEIIKKSLPAKIVRIKNPAKAVFQAIRIAVNNELDSLNILLNQAINFLNKNGKLLIITFHSIEDRIVKKFFKSLLEQDNIDPKLPIMVEKTWKSKSFLPSKEELNLNKRSRSAKLRVLTKLK